MTIPLEKKAVRLASNKALYAGRNRRLWVVERGDPMRTIDPDDVAATETIVQLYADPDLSIPVSQPVYSNRFGGYPYWVASAGSYDLYAPDDPTQSISQWEAISADELISEAGVHTVNGRRGNVTGIAEAEGVYVDDMVLAADDDAKLEAAALAAGSDRLILLSDRDYEIADAHDLPSLPLGMGIEKTSITATSADARITVGGLVGDPILTTGKGGGFKFDGAGVAEPPLAAVVLNTVNGDFGPIGVTDVKGHLLAILGQNNYFRHPNVAGASSGGSGYYFDNGAGGNHLDAPRASNCADVHCLFTQTATSSSGAYPVPEDNIIDHPIFEQQSLAWGNGNGSVRNEAGAWNVIRDPNCFSQYGSIFKITKNPNSGRSADLSGRLIIEGRIEATGGGAAHAQAAFEVDAVSGGVAGALTGDAGFVFIGTEFETAGVETVWRYGSTTPSISIGGDWTRYPFSETWWETNGSGALAGLAGYMLNQGQSSIGIGMLPGGTLSVEAAGGIGANLTDPDGASISLVNNGGGAAQINMGAGTGVGNTLALAIAHIHDAATFVNNKMLSLGRTGQSQQADANSTQLGDKLALLGASLAGRWGIGVQAGVGVFYGAAGGRWSFRQTAAAGQASVGSGALLPVEGADPVNAQDFVTKGFLTTSTGLYVPLTYLDTDGTLAANSDLKVATQKAVKTYVDAAKTALVNVRRNLFRSGTRLSTAAVAGSKYGVIAGASDQLVHGISVSLAGLAHPFYVDIVGSELAVAGATPKLILKLIHVTGGTAFTMDVVLQLFPLTVAAGLWSVGAAADPANATSHNQGIQSVLPYSSADFSVPADGRYAPLIVPTGASPTANADYIAELWVHYTVP